MNRRRRGTTVLELVVALLVTSVVASAGASAFAQVIARRTQVVNATAVTERDSALRALLLEWITSGEPEQPALSQRFEQGMQQARQVPRIIRDSVRGAEVVAQSAGPAFYFRTSVVTASGLPSVRVRLYLDDDPNTVERGLTFEYQRGNGEPYTRLELDPAVNRLDISYLDASTRQWRSATQIGSARVLAARVSLGTTEQDRSRVLALPMTFPMAAAGALDASDAVRP